MGRRIGLLVWLLLLPMDYLGGSLMPNPSIHLSWNGMERTTPVEAQRKFCSILFSEAFLRNRLPHLSSLAPISRPKSNRAIIGNAVKSLSAAAAMQERMFLFVVGAAVTRDSEQTNERATARLSLTQLMENVPTSLRFSCIDCFAL